MTDSPIPGPQAAPGEADMAAELAAKQAAAAAASEPGAAPMATETDVQALIEQMARQMALMQQQISQLQQDAGDSGEHPLLATARKLRYHLADVEGSDAHAPGVGLADDLVEAAGHAVESGDLQHVKGILGRLERWARRTGTRTGDDHHGLAARALIADHLPDQLDAFVPRPKAPQVGGGLPVKVAAGTVVDG
jgi:hypothetical protein